MAHLTAPVIDAELAQRLQDLQREAAGLRALVGLSSLAWVALAGAALAAWSRLRRIQSTLGGLQRCVADLERRLTALDARHAAQADDVAAAGTWAREEMARRRLRAEARRLRRCGTDAG